MNDFMRGTLKKHLSRLFNNFFKKLMKAVEYGTYIAGIVFLVLTGYYVVHTDYKRAVATFLYTLFIILFNYLNPSSNNK